MNKRKLDKTDIGEMHHWASSAFCAGFLSLQIDSDHAIELCERALDNDRITKENAKLREFVEMVSHAKVYTVEVSNPYGGADDMDCLCDSLKDKANQLLKQLLKDKSNDK